MERYQTIKAAIFEGCDPVPFWLCHYSHNDYYGDEWTHNNKESHGLVEVAWDCKKNKIQPSYIHETRDLDDVNIDDSIIKDLGGNKCKVCKVVDIVFKEYKDYYIKFEDSYKSKYPDIPEGIKIIIHRAYEPTFILDDGDSITTRYPKKVV
jgi:hypothetical protein